MKVSLKFLALMTGFVVVIVGLLWLQEVSAEIRDRSANQLAYNTLVRPATRWIRDFREVHQRFPTRTEMDTYATTNGTTYGISLFDSPPDWQRSWGKLGVDFMVCLSLGEWNLYHQSWDGGEWKAWNE